MLQKHISTMYVPYIDYILNIYVRHFMGGHHRHHIRCNFCLCLAFMDHWETLKCLLIQTMLGRIFPFLHESHRLRLRYCVHVSDRDVYIQEFV